MVTKDMTKNTKIWALIIAAITGGIAITAYAIGPAAEAGPGMQ
jgi:hypothetical protein